MTNPFTQRVSDIIVYSKEEASRLGNDYVGTEHLLLGILREGEGKAIEILSDFHLNLNDLKKEIEAKYREADDKHRMPLQDIPFNEETTRALKLCIVEAMMHRSEKVHTDHLLLAIIRKDTQASEILQGHGLSYEMLQERVTKGQMPAQNPQGGMDFTDEEDEDEDFPVDREKHQETHTQQTTAMPNTGGSSKTPILDSLGTDLTRAAKNGLLDPVVGREREIERVVQILSRRKKNNPVLIGEAGVGKTAIVEGLAMRIAEHKVSRLLFNKRIVTLNLGAMVAGTKYRGQFEERVQKIISEVQNNPDIIVFIDEIHTLVGSGSSSGSMDGANLLKPALSRGQFQCIGATTLDEYRESIEKDGALERRFQKVIVEPTTPEETLQILVNIKDRYEDHHQVSYSPEALKACVNLSERYITGRFFPDKAIDVLDEAGSRTHVNDICVPKEIEEQEKLIEEAKTQKNNAVKQQNFELAASFRDKEKAGAAQLAVLKEKWEREMSRHRKQVTAEDVAHTVSIMTGIPVHKMANDESTRILRMKEELQKRVIGQDKAIDTVVKAIRRSRIGLKDPNQPIGCFLFLGPTGVGKTYLAKQLAKQMFGSEDAMVRIDMSEFMSEYTYTRFIGSAPGYVGYNEGGQLTEQVRRKPYSIVLLDEIEKAHPNIFNVLLQMLDEGRLTDGSGRTVDFRHTIIIMTSNVGSRQLKEFSQGIGFSADRDDKLQEHSREIITKALNKTFAPEFINRLDEIINFEQLTQEDIHQIVDIELNKLFDRIKGSGYSIEVAPEAKDFLCQKGYDRQYGARPLKRAIQTYLEDPLAERMLSTPEEETKSLKVVMDDENSLLKIVTAD